MFYDFNRLIRIHEYIPSAPAYASSFFFSFQVHDEVGAVYCFICQDSTEADRRLSRFSGHVWETIKKRAALRKKLLSSDTYAEATRLIERENTQGDLQYHPSCCNNYSAVKRLRESENDLPVAKDVSVETRRESTIPKFDQQGLLRGSCLFYGKARNKIKKLW